LSATTLAAPVPRWRMGEKIGDWTIALIIFLGGFVIEEPAPYELLLIVVMFLWCCFGLRLNRHFMPMTVLMLLYLAGGFLAFTQLDTFIQPLVYTLTTGFLIASSIFFAAVIAVDPARRTALIRNAYLLSAVVVALIGILAYFGLFPHAEYFKLYDRAKGTFQDPNVFGPFLVLPLTFLVRDILTRRLRDSLWEIAWFLIVLFAIFLSFSRAAWGLAVFAMLAIAFLAFINAERQLVRFRLVAYLISGAVALTMLMTVAISIPAVRDLYVQRARIVQDYDEGRLGRFERQQIGFFLLQERPLGLGPFQFGKLLGEDEHNMWLKGFTVYGWLGGFAYIILVGWTLAAAAPLLFKPRPWQGVVQCTYVVFLGHLIIHNVIDNDHWRHLFLIYGILWGAVAAEKGFRRQQSMRSVTSVTR
jgi:hypothetical protein